MSEPSLNVELAKAVVLDDLPKVNELITSRGLPSIGYEILLDAVKLGRSEIVEFLLEKCFKVDSAQSNENPTLANGDPEPVQMQSANTVTIDTAEGYTLLLNAAKFGHTKISTYLLEKGISVNNEISYQNTPLHFAIGKEDVALVIRLLDYSAAVNALNKEKDTPLHVAVERDNINIVCLLLMKGARSLANSKKYNPLHVACIRKSTSMVELLLSTRPQSKFTEPRSLFDALCIASLNGSKEIVSLLISASADCNIFECYGYDDDFPLHLACKGGHLGVVKLLLEYQEQHINFVERESGLTPLHTACENGHTELISYLLTKHADLNIADGDGLTPLDLAAKTGNLKVVDLLCKNGGNVNAWNGRSRALVLAMENNHTEVAKVLLYRGASLNNYDYEHSPLRLCLKNRNHSLCIHILQLKPAIDKKLSVRILNLFKNEDYNPIVEDLIVYSLTSKQCHVGRFSLATAIVKGYRKTVQALISNGVNPMDGTYETVNKNCTTKNTQDENLVIPPLHFAAQKQQYGVIEVLLKAGCDVNAEDAKGNTPMHYFLWSHQSDRRFDIFELLVASGADLKKVPYALHKAVQDHDFQVYEYLVEECKLDVNARDASGATPLFHSVASEYTPTTRTARFLLSKGASVTLKNRNNETVLHRAVKHQFSELALIFMEAGADINAKNKDGETPLHIAARSRCVNIVEILLKFNAEVNCQDGEGRTPLHRALLSMEKKIIALLLDHNCDVNILDNEGKVAFGIVNKRTKGEIVNTVMTHLYKLKAAKMFLNEENKCLMDDICSEFDEWLEQFKRFEKKCKKERKRMKKWKLCCHLSLLEALVNPSNPAFISNEKVVSNLKSVDFKEFPIYRTLICNQFKKNEQKNACIYWLKVLIETTNMLNHNYLEKVSLEVLLEILSYLGENDQRRLILCGEALHSEVCKCGNCSKIPRISN